MYVTPPNLQLLKYQRKKIMIHSLVEYYTVINISTDIEYFWISDSYTMSSLDVWYWRIHVFHSRQLFPTKGTQIPKSSPDNDWKNTWNIQQK